MDSDVKSTDLSGEGWTPFNFRGYAFPWEDYFGFKRQQLEGISHSLVKNSWVDAIDKSYKSASSHNPYDKIFANKS